MSAIGPSLNFSHKPVLDTNLIGYGKYSVGGSISYAGNCDVVGATLKVVKKSVITALHLTKTYGTAKKLVLTLRDSNGNPIANAYIKVKISSKTATLKTNSKGRATLAVRQVPKTYVASITYKGSDIYSSASKKVKVVVKKANPRLGASARTFKAISKTKKYTVVLKNNLGKAMKGKLVRVTVNGKTYSAKTNSKGKATFNLNKLTKKGKFKATIRYGGDRCYNRVFKTTLMTVRK